MSPRNSIIDIYMLQDIIVGTAGIAVLTELMASCLTFAVSEFRCSDVEEKEEKEEELSDNLRIGLDWFPTGGGFNLSVIRVDVLDSSTFFTFSGQE